MGLSWHAARAVIVCSALGYAPAWSASTSYTGVFSHDDQVELISFSLNSTSDVIVRTLSYAGGTQADGHVVSPGGFDPNLTLFDAAGNFIDENDDGPPGDVPSDPSSSEAFDALLHNTLLAGSYTVALTQYLNTNQTSLADPFSQSGTGNYTGDAFGCSNGSFCSLDEQNRTHAWALDIVTQPIPEPATVVLLLAGLAALLPRVRRSLAP